MLATPVRTVSAPRPPELPPPRRLPVVATLAPLVVSLVLFAVTRSPYTLVFAALGPVVAIASTVDATLNRRRTGRRERARFGTDAARVADEIREAHQAERRAMGAEQSVSDKLERPPIVLASWRDDPGASIELMLGSGMGSSELRYEATAPWSAASSAASSAAMTPGVAAVLADLALLATQLEGRPMVCELERGIGIVGPALVGASLARSLVLQLAATLSPGEWAVAAQEHAEAWMSLLPHVDADTVPAGEVCFLNGDRSIRVVFAAVAAELPRDLDLVVEVGADGVAQHHGSAVRPELVSQEQATLAARALAQIAADAGIRPASTRLPSRLDLGDVGGDGGSPARLVAAVGVSGVGTLELDLVGDGPHAIVGGTTGSGKSELLLTWVLGMAATRSPDEVTFLFVDFKGGASFGSLADLPHSVGVITDLDAAEAQRALESLGAELRHRERQLALSGLRGIDDAAAAPFPRLVVVVDEYAALVETSPALHAVFADIAARGRSLGVHLVLCTQRPAGVVRDGILANCALRISLRVASAADSSAVLGADAAARLPVRPLGRALVSVGGSAPVEFQVALSNSQDVDHVCARWAGSVRPRAPWLPPLPDRVSIESLAPGPPSDEIPFALVDLPSEQAQRPIGFRPREHGALLVVGAAGSGKSGVLAALAAVPSDFDVRRVPSELPLMWDFLAEPFAASHAPTQGRGRLLLLDDVDSVLASCPDAYQGTLVELLARLLRDGPASGVWCVLTAQRVAGALSGLAALCGSQLVLRMPNRAEHALAGGEAAEFVATLPAGAGHWRGMRVQVGLAEPIFDGVPAAVTRPVALPTVRLAVVSTRPEELAAELRHLAPTRRVVALSPVGFGMPQDRAGTETGTGTGTGTDADLDVSVGDSPPILVGDPDAWQSQWSLLARLQRSGDILFDGCSIAEFRALTRSRELPPPFAPGVRPRWVRTPEGEVRRAILERFDPTGHAVAPASG